MPTPIYLDYNATTPVDPQALDAMLPFFRDHFGNASSEHSFGWTADEAVKQARERTARLIGATPRTMVFTSGATESVSLAIRGAGEVYGGRRHRIVTVRTEHRAVLATCEAMEREGYETTYLSVGPNGQVDLDELEAALNEETFLVSVMWANNETGVIQPIPTLAVSNTIRSALVGWSKSLSIDLAPKGITVNMLIPGRIHTERVDELDAAAAERGGISIEEARAASASAIPAGRYGTTEEFAKTAAFLVSAPASYITGSLVRCDGGSIRSV